MQSTCPDEFEIEQYLAGELAPQAREKWEEHISRCADCLPLLAAAGKWGEPVEVYRESAGTASLPGTLRRFRWGWAGAIAAAVLLAAGWIWSEAGFPFATSGGRQTQPGGQWVEREGVRIREGTGGVWSFEEGASGDRLGIRLEKGMKEIAVEPGGRQVEVRTPFGTVRDIGTRFRVRVGEVPGWKGKKTLGYVRTEVEEGVVELENRGKSRTIGAGHRGYAGDGIDPVGPIERSQAAGPAEIRDSLSRFAKTVDRNDRRSAFLAWQELLNYGAENVREELNAMFRRKEYSEEERMFWKLILRELEVR